MKLNLAKLADLFSIKLLLKTMFAPFHQYSANDRGRGPTEALKAWGNRTFSRFFGFFIRTLVIIIGLAAVLVMSILEAIWLAVWFVLPLAPVAYVILITMRII